MNGTLYIAMRNVQGNSNVRLFPPRSLMWLMVDRNSLGRRERWGDFTNKASLIWLDLGADGILEFEERFIHCAYTNSPMGAP